MKNIYDKSVEERVIKLTRIAHPEDQGQPTSELEYEIREAIKSHTLALIDAEIGRIIEMKEAVVNKPAKTEPSFAYDIGYKQAVADHLTYLKEQREIINNS